MRVCNVSGCGSLVPKGDGKCPAHRAEARRARGDAGYGAPHRRIRRDLIAKELGRPCPVCGTLMVDPRAVVADHSVPLAIDPNSKADRLTCRLCSDRQGGRLRWAR